MRACLKVYFVLGEEARFVEELGGLQVGERSMQRLFGHLGDGLQEGQGHLGADHGGSLEQALVLRRQAVDARCQHGLHRGRYLNGREGLRQAIGTALADQYAGLHQGARSLPERKGFPGYA